ncbi:DUF4153 domain-containing protein [Streptomyces sp. AcH 505]|uniref:DUF4153 domain-containing protein n=1 Tax=Streptomyces sp. AcH 505 TaxID=352211 RepID=UPI0005A81E84
MTEVDGAASGSSSSSGMARAAVGLLQGLALYLLFDASQAKGWAATHGPLFATLCTIAIFAPLIITTGLTHLRPRLLAGWTIIVALICAGLAYYDIIRDPILPPSGLRNLPSPQLWFALSTGLFVMQSLLISGASDHRLIARYATHFDVSWKYGVQILLAILFAGIFWLILWLGAELFKLIKLDFLAKLIEKSWFWIPATALVLNCAIHVTDVRVGIIRGVRTLGCNLLSWLLPLMTLIVVGFIAALLATGLEPLWGTRHASSILLIAIASLIFLINATYQDGSRAEDDTLERARPVSRILRIAVAISSITLVPLVLLAAYSIMLRVRQYGWTPDRIFATACTGIAACYAVGYVAALLRGRFLSQRLDVTNVASAFAALIVLFVLFTPVADPARISVADQVRLLNTGKIAPGKFDYSFLRFASGRYGTDALRKLAEQNSSTIVAEKASEVLKWHTRSDAWYAPATVRDRTGNITVAQPPGGSLPPEFLNTDWSASKRKFLLPVCMTGHTKCEAVLVDIDGDGIAEIVVLPSPSGTVAVFAIDAQKSWSYAGNLVNANCPGARDALLAGHFELADSQISKELNANGQRLHLNPDTNCVKEGPPK